MEGEVLEKDEFILGYVLALERLVLTKLDKLMGLVLLGCVLALGRLVLTKLCRFMGFMGLMLLGRLCRFSVLA